MSKRGALKKLTLRGDTAVVSRPFSHDSVLIYLPGPLYTGRSVPAKTCQARADLAIRLNSTYAFSPYK